MSIYRSPRQFNLKPYQSKARGRERIITGLLLGVFALFNFYLASHEGFISVLFGLLFGWSGVRNLLLGIRLFGLPERQRAYRVSTQGLYKVLEGQDLARLDLSEIQAVWLDAQGEHLSLMNERGVEVIKRDDLSTPEEWEEFTTWVERSITESIYRESPDSWTHVQQQSEVMSRLGERKTRGMRLMMLSLMIGAGILFSYWMQTHLLFILQTNQSDLMYDLLGAPSWMSLSSGEVNRLFSGIVLPRSGLSMIFNLAVLYWVGRALERVWGTWRALSIYFGGYIAGLFAMCLLDNHALYMGAQGGSLAIAVAAYAFNWIQSPSSSRSSSAALPEVLKKAKGHALITLIVFFLVIAFDAHVTWKVWVSWIVSAAVGGALSVLWMREGREQLWVLPQTNRSVLIASLLGASLPIASLIFATSLPHPLSQLSAPEEVDRRFTPLAIVELAQQCSGAPLEKVFMLPDQMGELLTASPPCSARERALLRPALLRLAQLYPLERSSDSTLQGARPSSGDAQVSTLPRAKVLTAALHRAVWLDRMTQAADLLSPEEVEGAGLSLINSITPLALDYPQDIFGNLLASQIAVLSTSRSGSTRQEIQTHAGKLSLSLEQGYLSWSAVAHGQDQARGQKRDQSEAKDETENRAENKKNPRTPFAEGVQMKSEPNQALNDESSQLLKGIKVQPDRPLHDIHPNKQTRQKHWFQVFNKRGEFTQLIMVDVGAQFNPSRAHRHKELLGSEEEAYAFVAVPHELSPTDSSALSESHARVKLSQWAHSVALTTWLKSSAF